MPPGVTPAGELTRPVLSVVVPVFNEARTVEEIACRLRKLPLLLEVIAVDDASTDGSPAALEELRSRGLVDRLVRHDTNRGKGAAIRSGIAEAIGEIIVVQDADLEY